MAEQKTILVVDDEPDVLTYLSTLLEDSGYRVVQAGDGNQASDLVKLNPPDLITLDVTMPEKSGVRFYREMKESQELKAIPIIIITGVSEDFERFISTRRQVPPPDGYLAKPVNREKLLELVGRLLTSA